MTMNTLTIGQLAREAGIGVETIRFYERKGLLEEPLRKESGYRLYQAPDIDKLLFIQRAKSLGFSLNEIRELMSLRSDPGTTNREIKEMAASKLRDIEEKIAMLKGMRQSLKTLVEMCPGTGPTSNCPILGSLESGRS